MAPSRASAAYKKKDGTLTLSKDNRVLAWTPVAPPGATPAFKLDISQITNLQQTPATNPKVMLRVFAQVPGVKEIEIHQFSFTAISNARAEADAIRDALGKAIQSAKAGNVMPAEGGAARNAGDDGTSAAMAIASAISSTPGSGNDVNTWHDDGRLQSDVDLQQSLLKTNPALQRTFVESLRIKPDAISSSQFTSHFWSTRIHLLRAHAMERGQKRGAYNVLSTIKPKTVDNATRLSISKEQIQLIFSQHPLVKRVYDECVPKLSEESFWGRFFQSRLFKKLKGEKISEDDPTDPTLDKYLSQDEDASRAQRLLASHVSHIIDVEGNEENHSQRKGNAPDFTMRPKAADKVPIIRTLNVLSEKIMSHVAPNDVNPSDPIGMDEETYNSIALQDLQGDAEENRMILNITDQNRFFASDKESGISADARLFAKQDPTEVVRSLSTDLFKSNIKQNLDSAIGVFSDSDSDDDDRPKQSHIGSKSSLRAASTQIFSALAQQRIQNDGSAAIAVTSTSMGLSTTVFDRLTLTHATTTEFLSHFWDAFLSGIPSRAGEIASLVETLDRAMDRIRAVGDDAEKERERELERLKKGVKEHYEKTGRRVRFEESTVGGGRQVVDRLFAPTVKAIGIAVGAYQKALGEVEER